MTPLDNQQQAARDWFESLRDRICAEFEAIEREAGNDARFQFISWDRTDDDGTPGARRPCLMPFGPGPEPCR